MLKILFFSFLLGTFTGCFKTTEQAQREKMIDSLSLQMTESQKLMAELTLSVKEMETKMGSLTGQIEEGQHGQTTLWEQRTNALSKQIEALTSQFKMFEEQSKSIQEEVKGLKAENSRLSEEIKSLEKKNTKKSEASASTENVSEKIEKGLALYKQQKLAEAKTLLEPLSLNPKSLGKKRNIVLNALGMIEFQEKNFDSALIYFSKIYSSSPNSPVAKNALLYLGKGLVKLKKENEAREAFKELLDKFPGTKEAREAQTEISKL